MTSDDIIESLETILMDIDSCEDLDPSVIDEVKSHINEITELIEGDLLADDDEYEDDDDDEDDD